MMPLSGVRSSWLTRDTKRPFCSSTPRSSPASASRCPASIARIAPSRRASDDLNDVSMRPLLKTTLALKSQSRLSASSAAAPSAPSAAASQTAPNASHIVCRRRDVRLCRGS